MAYAITNYSFPGVAGAKPRITAVLDSAADVEALGGTEKWSPGSLAILAEAGFPTLLLSKSNGWVNGNTGGSGGGSGLPSGSSPNQYLVTDSEGNAKWEDKLAWSESSEEEIQPECHPELMENNESFSRFYIDGVANLTVGETYIVNWNGVDYRCVVKAPGAAPFDAAPKYAVLGNTAKMDETGDTGEPFVITVGRYRDTDPSEYEIYAFDCATELTLSIRHYVETINKLSGKYVEGMGWSEKSTKEVLPETFVAEPARQESGLNLYQINCALAGGKKYTVIYNGAAYDVISHVVDEDTVLAGNFAVVGEGDDTGEPFLISYNSNLGGTMVGTLDSGGITIAIYCEDETVHPIDKKYLPGGTVSNYIVVRYDAVNDVVSCNMTAEQYLEHLANFTLDGGCFICSNGISNSGGGRYYNIQQFVFGRFEYLYLDTPNDCDYRVDVFTDDVGKPYFSVQDKASGHM